MKYRGTVVLISSFALTILSGQSASQVLSTRSSVAPQSVETLSSGVMTVEMSDGLDSASEKAGALSDATVVRSSVATIPAGTTATVELLENSDTGGFSAQLIQFHLADMLVRTASSPAVLAGGWTAAMNNKLRQPGAPRDAVAGPHLFLPQGTIVRFTLVAPSLEQAAHAAPPGPALIGSESFDLAAVPDLGIPLVAQLRNFLLGGGGLITLKADGFQGTLHPGQARENIILDGNLQRVPECCFRGVRMNDLAPGQPLKVLQVRAFTDGGHDVLHLLVESQFPIFGNIAIVLPKDTLGTMSESQMESLLAPWIVLVGARTSSSSSPSATNVGQQSVPVVNQWTVQLTKIPGAGNLEPMREVVLHGTSTYAGSSAAAYLALECREVGPTLAVRFPDQIAKPSNVYAFDGSDGVGEDQKLFRFTVGAQAGTFRNVSGGQHVEGTFDLDYTPDKQLLEQLLDPPDTPVTVTVLSPDHKGSPLRARFVLPSNTEMYRGFMQRCLGADPARRAETVDHTLALSPEAPSVKRSATITAPGYGLDHFNIFYIDTRAFTRGGVLRIDVQILPESATSGSFVLFPASATIPTQGRPSNMLAFSYDVPRAASTHLDYRFPVGKTFILALDGNWFSPKGARGDVQFTASVSR